MHDEPVPGLAADAPQIIAQVIIECAKDGNTRVRGDYTNFPLNSLIASLEMLKMQVIQQLLMRDAMTQMGKPRIVPANGPVPPLRGG